MIYYFTLCVFMYVCVLCSETMYVYAMYSRKFHKWIVKCSHFFYFPPQTHQHPYLTNALVMHFSPATTPDREIEGFDVSVAPVEFGQTSFIVIAGTAGTDVTIFCDYGDDVYGSGTIEEDWTSDIIGARNFNITYEQIGRYNVTCWVSNDRSYLVTSVEACVDQAQRGTFTVSIYLRYHAM